MDIGFTIQYNRIGNYPGPGLVGPNAARHHIISYPFMQVYAVVAAWYCCMEEGRSLFNDYDRFFQARGINWNALQTQLAGKTSVDLEITQNLPHSGIINWVCWAESNLFIGPAGCFRKDDPSQRVDKLPLSMDAGQKALAERVVQAWNEVANPAVTGEANQFIRFTIKNTGNGKLRNFVEAFLKYINHTRVIHVTRYDDWTVVPVDGGRELDYSFWINPTASLRNRAGKLFPTMDCRFRLRDSKADGSEPVVCVRDYNHKKQYVVGLLKDRSGMSEQDCMVFEGNSW